MSMKSLHLGKMGCTKYSNGQVNLANFKQPILMNLMENNRWVKKLHMIPWLGIKKNIDRNMQSLIHVNERSAA